MSEIQRVRAAKERDFWLNQRVRKQGKKSLPVLMPTEIFSIDEKA